MFCAHPLAVTRCKKSLAFFSLAIGFLLFSAVLPADSSASTSTNVFGPFSKATYTGTGKFVFRIPVNPNTIQTNGNLIRINVAAGLSTLNVIESHIGEQSSDGDVHDMLPDTVKSITFDNGKTNTSVAASETKYSDWVVFPFDKTKKYIVSIRVTGGFCAWNRASAGSYYSLVRDGRDSADVSGYNTSTDLYVMERMEVAGDETAVDASAKEAGSEQEAGPVKFNLAGNYPNPFNVTTTIEYSVAERSTVELTIYSTSGQKVAVLENRVMDTGKHSIKWDAGNLASGTYIARLATNKGIFTRKMLFLK